MSSLQSRADTAATISGIDRVATLHKIESEPSAAPATTLLLNHAARGANATTLLLGKRSSSSPKNEEPHKKKARTTASSGKQLTSYMALPGLAKGIFDGIWVPHVVSPRPDIQDVQVEQVQELAFPSLPHICSLTSLQDFSPSGVAMKGATNEEDQDLLSYGWFISMDEDETGTAEEDHKESSCPKFLPDTKHVLATAVASQSSNQDLEIQQALAEDTIDDVLGDLI